MQTLQTSPKKYYSLLCLRDNTFSTYESGEKVLLSDDVSLMIKTLYITTFFAICAKKHENLLQEEIILCEEFDV